MPKLHRIISLCLLLSYEVIQAHASFPVVKESTIRFRKNAGQVTDQQYNSRPDILYYGNASSLSFFIKRDGFSYQLMRSDSLDYFDTLTMLGKRRKVEKHLTVNRVDFSWINCHATEPEAGRRFSDYENYYLESCPTGALKVPSFGELTHKHLYDGIDLHWYSKNNSLKYSYLVAKGADYKQIRVKIEGASSISISQNGELYIHTSLGNIIEQAPIVYQELRQLPARWVVDKNEVYFHIDSIDPALPIEIDPLVKAWCTYYGGNGNEWISNLVSDNNGNIFGSGETTSMNNICTSGAFQTSFGGAAVYGDAFLFKFSTSGVRQWATYYGSKNDDFSNHCFLDSKGHIYITGGTDATNGAVIATPGSHQPLPTGGLNVGAQTNSAFLAKFDANGNRLWGTFYGGSSNEWAYSGKADGLGNVFMLGTTYSQPAANEIATPGAYQGTFKGVLDVFLVKFSEQGVRQWGTYFGGPGQDELFDLDTDSVGNIYACGRTNSLQDVVTPGCIQPTKSGGFDALFAKFSSSGSLIWASYYGGVAVEEGLSATVIHQGVYFGLVSHSNFNGLATPGSHQPIKGGQGDNVLLRCDLNGTLVWSTYYGGSGNETGCVTSADSKGNILISGSTASGNGTVIATACTYQDKIGGGSDAFVAKFNSLGQRLWGTYYGDKSNTAAAIAIETTNGDIYLAGHTTFANNTIFSTATSHQPAYAGGQIDAFLVKFENCKPPVPLVPPAQNICIGQSTTLSVTPSCGLEWQDLNAGTLYGSGPAISVSPTVTTVYEIVDGSCGPGVSSLYTVIVNPLPAVKIIPPFSACSGNSVVLHASGASSYTWQPGTHIGKSFTVTPVAPMAYYLSGKDSFCVNSASVLIKPIHVPTLTIKSDPFCNNTQATLTASGAQSYTWTSPGTSANNSVLITMPLISPTIFTVAGSNAEGNAVCTSERSIAITPLPAIEPVVSGEQIICEGDSVTLSAKGGSSYFWFPTDNLQNFYSQKSLASPSVTTVYSVVISHKNLCAVTATALVTVNPNPFVDAGPDQVINYGEGGLVTALGEGTIKWLPGDGLNCYSCGRSYIDPRKNTCYTAQATSDKGCVSYDEVCVEVQYEQLVFLPNSFTPNGDGVNDFFVPVVSGVKTYKLEIFNRWGELIFYAEDPHDVWRGEFKGQSCEVGVYSYLLTYTTYKSKQVLKSGPITLLK